MHRLSDLFDNVILKGSVNDKLPVSGGNMVKVNIIAMGDVGGTVLLGLRLLGGEYISSIGIFDLNPAVTARYEREINQVSYPDGRRMPKVEIISQEKCFDCDVFVFCATKAVPPLGENCDVRMAQFEANKGLVELYANQAVAKNYQGLFAVVSDPVDPLCMCAACCGLRPMQIKGYGLGVMFARALYAAEELGVDEVFREKGRAFGPHGADLVIADNIDSYNNEVSLELTKRAVNSNLVTRESGFKPYIAPAMSSAAISILETIRGGMHYSSVYTGKVYLGCRNQLKDGCCVIEDMDLADALYERIEKACNNLAEIVCYE